MNRKYILIVIFICFNFLSQGQCPIGKLDACSYSINEEADTIQFLKINRDLETPKPTIIFLQGSLPIPLIIEFNNGDVIFSPINNFDYKKIAERYNFVLISMPHVPIIASEKDLNNQFAYITDKKDVHSYPRQYLENNYLEKYEERCDTVINFLVRQKWVDKNNLILVGHSQGARIAASVAANNPHVTALGFLSGDPLGRITQYIRKLRLQEQMKLIDPEEAQKKIDRIYQWWEWLNQHAGDSNSQSGEDSPKTILSFSKSIINELVTTKIPVYIAYGTEDINAADYCDLLPIDFIAAGKKNYKVVPYIGLEHNYMDVDSLGKPILDNCHWDEVMTDFIKWVELQNGNRE